MHHFQRRRGECVIEEKYYEPPLINVIKFACNACAEKEGNGHRRMPGLPGTSMC